MAPEEQLQCSKQFLRQSLTVLNARANSPLPSCAAEVLRTHWLPLLSWRSPLLTATMQDAGTCVGVAAHLSTLMEASLETFFKEGEEEGGEEEVAFKAELERVRIRRQNKLFL